MAELQVRVVWHAHQVLLLMTKLNKYEDMLEDSCFNVLRMVNVCTEAFGTARFLRLFCMSLCQQFLPEPTLVAFRLQQGTASIHELR